MHPQYPQQPQQGPYPPPAFGYPAQPGYPATPWLPPQPPKPQWGKVAAAALAAVLAVGGGALLAHHRTQSNIAGSAGCAVEGARTTTVDSKGNGEPTVMVPIRSGWEKFSADDIPGSSKMLSDPAIRGIFANRDISENGFTPNIVVTLEKYTDQTLSPEQITLNASTQLGEIAQIGMQSTATVCGSNVTIADFTGVNKEGGNSSQSGTSIFTAVRGEDGNQWLATATINTTNTSNQEYQNGRDALVEGFHVQFPKTK